MIYKKVDEFWCWVCRNLGLMMCEGLLKENIDGEVLFWVYAWLIAWLEEWCILMVISDGALVDDSMLLVNSGIYLEWYLCQVV
ncbi:cobaltochelatase CobT-related protein, partial [Klebsiella pneumoniae]|uniref:cobaltochelatase CobT-related protein n=1 Tax=Klebsiella pneumoniae TaxID=573 RepID=UPI002811087C